MSSKSHSANKDKDVHGSPPPAGATETRSGSVFVLKPGVPASDPVARRHALRRLAESANRLSRPNRLFVLHCQGRGCRRRLGQVLSRPQGGGTTPDGTIETNYFTDGPVFVIFGPFDETQAADKDEFRLRGTRESITARSHSITLRAHRLREDGTTDPVEVPLRPGRSIVIVCGCGHRNDLNMSALSERTEKVRAALDAW